MFTEHGGIFSSKPIKYQLNVDVATAQRGVCRFGAGSTQSRPPDEPKFPWGPNMDGNIRSNNLI